MSSAVEAKDKTKGYRPQGNTQFPHYYGRYGPAQVQALRFFVLFTLYFFGIVRRQDSVPGCWWRRDSGSRASYKY